MTQRARKRWFNVVRVLICVAALWFVVQGVTIYDRVALSGDRPPAKGMVIETGDPVLIRSADGSVQRLPRETLALDDQGEPIIRFGLRSTWNRSAKLFLLLAVLIHFPVLFPQAYRFQLLLGAQGITMGYFECVKLSVAGNFLNFAAPLGSNAGDVFKAYFASLHTGSRKPEAVATVILDRVIGLGSLVLVVACITSLSPSGSRLAEIRPYMLTILVIGVAAAAAYLSPFFRRFVPATLLNRLPMSDKLRRLDGAARTLANHKTIVVTAILLTVFLQALAMLAYFTVAVAIGLDAGWQRLPEFFAYFYTGTVVQALPGPPQGLGTVELTYRYFFSSFGSPAQIVCMALAIRIVALTCALPGLWVAMTGAYRPKKLADMDEALIEAQAADPTEATQRSTVQAP
jgi:glycosyltransferase 2 family protein